MQWAALSDWEVLAVQLVKRDKVKFIKIKIKTSLLNCRWNFYHVKPLQLQHAFLWSKLNRIKGINAVCDPQFHNFYKIEIKTFTFCTGPIAHACPVQLIPKVTKEISENHQLNFTFYKKSNQKEVPDFWLRWLFPPIVAQIYQNKMLGRVAAGKIDSRWKTDFKVAKEEDQYWSCRHRQVLLCINWHVSISVFHCLTWKYISLSLSNPQANAWWVVLLIFLQ